MAKILIIEDNPINMKLAVMLLERSGYQVLQANRAVTGIDLAKQQHPDLILMDIQLPGIDGLTAARMLKADIATRDILVYALTAFAMKGDEKKMREAGCDGYIAKPIHYQEFLATIASALADPSRKKSETKPSHG